MQRIHHDPSFHYPVPGTAQGTCDLEVYSNPEGTLGVVVWTELADNPGMSVTNAAEQLAVHVHRLLRKWLPDPSELYFVERYDHRSYHTCKDPERLALLKFQERQDFTLHSPSWHHIQGNLQEVLQGITDSLTGGH